MNSIHTRVQESCQVLQLLDTRARDERQNHGNGSLCREMSAGAEEVSATVTDITTATKEGSVHTDQIAAAAEEQLASIEEVASSSQALSRISAELQEQVRKFQF